MWARKPAENWGPGCILGTLAKEGAAKERRGPMTFAMPIQGNLGGTGS